MRLVFDKAGERYYETGTDRGVLYPWDDSTNGYGTGVVWNGLISVNESPGGAEATDMYADNIKYASLRSAETFGATIEAYQSPAEFDVCDGSAEVVPGGFIGQQNRKAFGFAYRTMIGSDTTSADENYKLHLIYGATAAPSEKAYGTINDSPDAITLSWEIETTPVEVPNYKPTASMVIDSRTVAADKLKKLEDILYGTDTESGTEPRLPLPSEVISIMSSEN
mgnify:FL=1